MATMQIKSMDDQLYNALKIKAKSDNRSLSQQVIMILKNYLSKPENQLPQQTENFLKLAGSWKDDRSAEKIIQDFN
jgi:plasmid stability protein